MTMALQTTRISHNISPAWLTDSLLQCLDKDMNRMDRPAARKVSNIPSGFIKDMNKAHAKASFS